METEARDDPSGIPAPAVEEAVVFDYGRNRTIRASRPIGSRSAFRVRVTREQPIPSPEEFQAALALVRTSATWGPLLAAGLVTPYRPIPPVLEPEGDEEVERTLFVGLVSRERRFNQIAAVNMVRREVSPGGVRPRGVLVSSQLCGQVEDPTCGRLQRGTPGRLLVEWPAEDPLWRFVVVRPSASSGSNGSGIELLDVRYRGRRVLRQAHLPILNVEYAENACGPFRDWQYEETCFQAVGQDVPKSPGFRWCTEPPQTILDNGQDGGSFRGVALFESPEPLLHLVTELAAGWYRYVMEWHFHPDGRLQPRFRFGAVADSCVCNLHNHHAFWRFDFDVVRRGNVLEEQTAAGWGPIPRETIRTRQEGQPFVWRVRHPKSGAAYRIVPGPDDGVGDVFSGPDAYALRRRKGEIDDGGGRKPIFLAKHNLLQFVRGEKLTGKDLVVWYAAHFIHNEDEEGDPLHAHDHDVAIGPDLVPENWPS